jgi:hypothetical protein
MYQKMQRSEMMENQNGFFQRIQSGNKHRNISRLIAFFFLLKIQNYYLLPVIILLVLKNSL